MPAITVVDRQQLHCVLCGVPLVTKQIAPHLRDAWCATKDCAHVDKVIRFNDPLLTMLILNESPPEIDDGSKLLQSQDA